MNDNGESILCGPTIQSWLALEFELMEFCGWVAYRDDLQRWLTIWGHWDVLQSSSCLSTCLLGGRFMAITQNLTAPGCPTLSPVFHLCPGHPPSWNLSAVSSHQPSMCPLALFPLSCPFSGLVPSALLVLPLSPVSGALPAILYPSSLHSQPCSVPWALQSQFR